MTLIKSTKNGQAVLEYFILTTVVVALLMFFTKTTWFADINTHLGTAFNAAADKITSGGADSSSSVPAAASAPVTTPSTPSTINLPLSGPSQELPGNIHMPAVTIPDINGGNKQ